ncbi:MAG: PTS sugar transporter subunit IIA [Spirochaetaceae bacterium]|jgi:PTS system nitrogen regulatory IIA component|nr:PTS sugar transporter subunit IIA [Spirochaetaceae bacterium]
MTESLLPLLERGGVVHDVEGSTPAEAVRGLIARLKLPGRLDGGVLLNAVLEREDLQPTAAGHGIALPHPRNPVISAVDEQFIAIGLTKRPLNWQALDGEAVRTIILVVSSNARHHLRTLSKLNYFCTQQGFLDLLRGRAAKEDVERYVADAEKAWENE